MNILQTEIKMAPVSDNLATKTARDIRAEMEHLQNKTGQEYGLIKDRETYKISKYEGNIPVPVFTSDNIIMVGEHWREIKAYYKEVFPKKYNPQLQMGRGIIIPSKTS